MSSRKSKNDIKDVTVIEKILPKDMEILQNIIYFHYNEYGIGKLDAASLQYCHLQNIDNKRYLRISWDRVFLMVGVDVDPSILLPNQCPDGYLAFDKTDEIYTRVFKVDQNMVQFNEKELMRKLPKEIMYKNNKLYPSIIPMINITKTSLIKYIKRNIRKNQIIKYSLNKIIIDEEDDDIIDILIINNQEQKESSDDEDRGIKRPINTALNVDIHASGKSKKLKSKQSLLDAFFTPNNNNKSVSKIKSLPKKSIKKNKNIQKDATKSVKKTKKEYSQDFIKDNAVLLYTFDDEINIYKLQENESRYILLNDKYVLLNYNCFLFTHSRINTLSEEYKRRGKGYESTLHCDSCNKWLAILEETKQPMIEIKATRDQLFMKGFTIVDFLSYFRGDYAKDHLKSKIHIKCAKKLDNYCNKPLEKALNKLKSKIESGQLTPAQMAYFPIFLAVYCGIKNHWSNKSIISLKSDFLQRVVDFYVEKIVNKTSKKTEAVFNKLKKSINEMKDLNDEHKRSILKEIEKRSDELLHYIDDLDITVPKDYNNNAGISKMVQAIADEIRVGVWGDLAASPINALLCDESTCLSQIKRLIVYMIYLINADTAPEAKISFIDIIDVTGADAEGIMGMIESLLVDINLFLSVNAANYDDWKDEDNKKKDALKYIKMVDSKDPLKLTKYKTVWGGTDGASVMSKLMRLIKSAWSFYLLWIHCIAHRGALGGKDVDEHKKLCKTLKELGRTANNLQCFLKNSPKVRQDVQAYGINLNTISTEIHYLIRWLSKCQATNAHLNNVSPLIKFLNDAKGIDSYSQRKDKMIGFIKQLSNFNDWHKKTIIADQLSILQPLRYTFQRNILDFDGAEDTLNEALDDLEEIQINKTMGKQEKRLIAFKSIDEDDNNVNKQSYYLEERQNTTETKQLWLTQSIRVFKDHSEEKYNRNIFLKDTSYPIHYYSQQVIEENQNFKLELATINITCYKNRFDNLKVLRPLRMFNPKIINSFLAVNVMPDRIKNTKSKNQKIKWFSDHSFLEDDAKSVCELIGGYYGIDVDEIITNELREFIYLMWKYRDWDWRQMFKQKYNEFQTRTPGLALLGRHTLIAPYNAAICDRGFSEQNLNITKLRASIRRELLRNVMMINIEGPNWDDEDDVFDLIIRALKRFISMSQKI